MILQRHLHRPCPERATFPGGDPRGLPRSGRVRVDRPLRADERSQEDLRPDDRPGGSNDHTGIYVMYFEYIPGLTWRSGYPFALALMVVLSVLLCGDFKRYGWL
jgi:hypothetical protein